MGRCDEAAGENAFTWEDDLALVKESLGTPCEGRQGNSEKRCCFY